MAIGSRPLASLPLASNEVAAGSNNTMAAPLGTLTLTGLVPTITQNVSLTAVLGTITLTGLVPAITHGNSLTAVLGTLTLTGLVPTVAQGNGMTAPLGTLTLTGLVPTVTQGNTLAGVLGTLTLTGLAPTFDQTGPNIITAPLGVLTLNGLVPTITQTGGGYGLGGTAPAGSAGKHRRKLVEIDGETFEVGNKREALQLLEQVRDLALERAQEVVTLEETRPPKPPVIETSLPIQPEIKAVQYDIRAMYEAAARGQRFLDEWIAKEAQDRDDDDALSVLLH